MRERLSVRSGDALLAVEVAGTGPPLVWAHGLLSSKELALAMLRHVTPLHRVAVFDQRGHGSSSGTIARLEDLAGDVPAVMDALGWERAVMDALGWERAVLGGDSMGAAVVLAVAAERPARVAGLVIDRPAVGAEPRPAFAQDARRIRSGGLDAWVDAQLDAAPPAERALLAARYEAVWRAQDGASIAAAYDALSTWVQPLPAADGPAVVRGCADDVVHPLALAQRLARTLGARFVESSRLAALDAELDARVIERAVVQLNRCGHARV